MFYRISFISASLAIISILAVWLITKNDQHPSEAKISGAYQALNFWSAQRAYPNKAIPDSSHYAAYQWAEKNIPKSILRSDEWESIGPLNTSGRTLALAINPLNPETIYAGSASGGLWRSRSGGLGETAWEYVSTSLPVLGVSTIAISSLDTSVMYIGTGEVYNYQKAGTGAADRATRGSYGIGILKTVDGGNNWVKSLDWSYNQMRGVNMIKINPLDQDVVWAATTEGVYKSVDGGINWALVLDVIMATDLVINPIDTATVIVGCGNFGSLDRGIYTSHDGGGNWSKAGAPIPSSFQGKIMLDIYKSYPQIVYASIGNGFLGPDGASWLCRSEDGGDTWTIQSTEDYSKWQGWFAHDVAVNPSDSSEVIAIGIDVWKSANNGSSLSLKAFGSLTLGTPSIGLPDGPPDYIHADLHEVIYHPDNNNIIYFGSDGGVFRSMDGAQTFESINGGYQTVQFYNGFSVSQTDSLLCMGGLQDNSTIIYRGNPAWTRVIGGDGSYTGIDNLDNNRLFASYQFLNVARSEDGGNNWDFLNIPGNGPTAFIAPFVFSDLDPFTIYAGRDVVYKSVSSGTSWFPTNSSVPLDGNPILSMAVAPFNNDIVYAATAPNTARSGVFISTDGGNSWTNITGVLPDRYPTDLFTDPVDEGTVYVTFSGFGTSHLFKSSDYGLSWTDIGIGLPDVPASAVIVDPLFPDHIYLGNDLGVFVSYDGGLNWNDYNEGLFDAVLVMDMKISSSNRKLRIATHGNGAFERNLTEELPSFVSELSTIDKLEVYPNPFDKQLNITYSLTKDQNVKISAYDLQGRLIEDILEQEQLSGTHKLRWEAPENISTGIIIIRFQTEFGEKSLRIINSSH